MLWFAENLLKQRQLKVYAFCLSVFEAPAQPPANLMWIQEGNNISLSWDPVKAKDNESDVIGYMVTIFCLISFIRWKTICGSIFSV